MSFRCAAEEAAAGGVEVGGVVGSTSHGDRRCLIRQGVAKAHAAGEARPAFSITASSTRQSSLSLVSASKGSVKEVTVSAPSRIDQSKNSPELPVHAIAIK